MNNEKPQFDYQNFDLLIEAAGKAYVAKVINSPAGDDAATQFSLPFSELELENFLLKIGQPRRGVRRLNSPEMKAAKIFGQRLFDSVFGREVFACLRSSLEKIEAKGSAGLRLRLRLNAPELADLPWEYLYNAALNRFLVLAVKTPLVRYIELQEGIRPLAVQPPLKILVMLSSPTDYPQLDVEEEWTKLQNALGDLQKRKLVALERLDEATLPALQQRLRRSQSQYHIFHFIGHGGYDEAARDGVLLMEDETRHSRKVSGQSLGTILHNHRPLRLAVLNACEGARASRTDPFTGVAQSLVQQGLPAVIAMQFEITDAAAITLSHEFYAALADGYPVDAALVEARTAIYAGGNDVEWGTPVLYMRAPDGKIFDIERAQQAPPIRETPKPKESPIVPPSKPVAEKKKPPAPPPSSPIAARSSRRTWLLSGIALTLVVLVWLISKSIDRGQPPAAPTLLSITTLPASATVLLDGNAIGNSPISAYRANAGKFVLRIQKQNYFSLDTTVVLVKGQETKVSLALKPALAWLTIQVNPADAEVILDGESLAASKRQKRPVSLGMHSLNLSREGYKSKPLQFRVTAARDTTVRFALDRNSEYGIIHVLAFLDGRLYIDDKLKGNIASGDAPEYDQPVGSYKVEVEGARENVSQTVNVVKGKTVTVTLRPKSAPPPVEPKITRLRSWSRNELSDDDVKSMLAARGFFDKSSNKNASGFANDYELRTISGEQVVVDKTSGLMWQRGGSPSSMLYADVEQYIQRLNTTRFAGFSDWRLPTLEEAMSLMEPRKLNGKLYIDSKFDTTQSYIWTADKSSDDVVWLAYFDDGGYQHSGVTSGSYIRAVRVGQ